MSPSAWTTSPQLTGQKIHHSDTLIPLRQAQWHSPRSGALTMPFCSQLQGEGVDR